MDVNTRRVIHSNTSHSTDDNNVLGDDDTFENSVVNRKDLVNNYDPVCTGKADRQNCPEKECSLANECLKCKHIAQRKWNWVK